MCRLCRRGFLTGAAALAAHTALPAFAQFPGAIKPQSDPWAQVDPYDDPRNGFSGGGSAPAAPRPGAEVFSRETPAPGLMSDTEEIELGRTYYPKLVADEGGPYGDARLQRALRRFFTPMSAVSDRPHLPWEIVLTNSPAVNALAFAGGKVLVCQGLLSACTNAGELAATLAHEIGHVDKRHTVRGAGVGELVGMMKQQGAAPVSPAQIQQLLGGRTGQVQDVWDIFRLAYTRENEAEADAHEMVILERLGVDPIHAINDQINFARLEALLGGDPTHDLARSHPRNADRMEHIRHLAAFQKKPAQDFVFPGWEELKAAFPTAPEFKRG